ncbi:unnamed protein product [Urochloa humidicola]
MVDIHISAVLKASHSQQNYLRIQDDTLQGMYPQLMLLQQVICWKVVNYEKGLLLGPGSRAAGECVVAGQKMVVHSIE